jgi:hypothetical protein
LWLSAPHTKFPVTLITYITFTDTLNDLQNQLSLEESTRQQGDTNIWLQSKNYTDSKTSFEEPKEISSNKFDYGTYYIETSQTIGQQIKFGSHSNHYKKQIEANTKIKFTITPGGNYGFALTDLENNVLDFVTNSGISENTEKIFIAHEEETILWLSAPHTKFPVILITNSNLIDTIEE